MYDRTLAIPQGLAKVEIIANKSEIGDFLQRGFSYIRIYRELMSQNKITMKYPTFVYQLQKLYPELKKQKQAISTKKKQQANKQPKKQLIRQAENKQKQNAIQNNQQATDERPFREADKSPDDLI